MPFPMIVPALLSTLLPAPMSASTLLGLSTPPLHLTVAVDMTGSSKNPAFKYADQARLLSQSVLLNQLRSGDTLTLLRIWMLMREIKTCGRGHSHGPRAFNMCPHCHEHSSHIGVMCNGNWRRGPTNVTALNPILRKTSSLLIGSISDSNALNTHCETSGVHHDEHVLKATIFFSDQIPNRTSLSLASRFSSNRKFAVTV